MKSASILKGNRIKISKKNQLAFMLLIEELVYWTPTKINVFNAGDYICVNLPELDEKNIEQIVTYINNNS